MIVIPRYSLIKEKASERLPELLENLNLKKPLVITGKNTKKYSKGFEFIYYDEIDIYNEEGFQKIGKEYDSIIGIGGGKPIDIGKIISNKSKKPFVSVPTTASNDGIASPIVSLTQPSYLAESPIAIVADIDIIRESPKKLLSAGMGDIVSNITAVLDWELGKIEMNEKYSDSSGIFSKTIAIELIDYVLNYDLKEYPKKLVKSLIGSGISIAIAHSSRPASGSEHLFSHALDNLKNKYELNINSLHGEQCGLGTIIISQMYYEEGRIDFKTVEKVKNSLKAVNAPVTGKKLGFDEDLLIEALSSAHKVRKRHTILRNGLSKEKAREILEKSEII
ncbi:Glutamate-1-semialdehyde 2,1-aminomutase [Methanococcus vannielii SB]|uniref:Glycerol-1-phosphate dehydrogenase [NAD(P)+] n=1 Tax=Methanococcus vannielii (strain ATCC 35089 / DSM 1224 / JCM 13029 / OCM 148 / SB) TaxID=406327 RepID=G1PDH_METVS|nr:iron-containing alcohol dehydrogenase [Methanococcus vannielii]A6URL4.1 RecName: Full=Glycerol-1-phosphate dehydrogenase [NAD(P)+]; Short=G1P dehydrogenase; Short=G1PDH; AltName: Full=Enantiomeric glycerophosphate synthase; AltName: Full=sn-glycerol-1-phosphate dehydrogenase [Methanococcus vannielii SB]ABR55136.1 Glutamate-1-semialdehyde 2,1-aminomutase [Methanococcus vannielii SB]